MLRYFLPLVFFVSAALAAPIPTLSSSQPGTQLIGESFSQELCLQNTGDATGYQPQYEIVTPQGIVMGNSFTYIGESFSIKQSFTCNAAQCDVVNNDTGAITTIDENESFYVIDYPLGSFPTSMVQQCITTSFTLDTNSTILPIATPTDIKVTPLFSLGATAVDDGSSIYGSGEDLTVIPNVFTITKMIHATEGETATGENFPHNVTLDINVANGQSVTGIIVEDQLPPEMHFKSLINDGGCTQNSLPDFNTTQLLKLTCGTINGTVASKEKTISFDFYIPENDALGNPVINPDSGDNHLIVNTTKATANYDGNSVSDEDNATIVAKVFTSHKTMQIITDNGISGISPYDIVRYTITMDVSDYFSIKNLIVDDNLSDAQLALDLSAHSNFKVQQDGGLTGGNFVSGSTAFFRGFDSSNGDADYQFYLSDANGGGSIDGDAIDGNTLQGPTRATINFDVEIQESHRAHGSSGERKVKSGDVMSNANNSQAELPDGTLLPHDSSDASERVGIATGAKSIYALNGNLSPAAPVIVAAGETVTYRLKMNFPINSFSELNITDFLPSPLFDAAQFSGTFDSSTTPDAPPSGSWKVGPDNQYGVAPIVVSNASQNTVVWSFHPDDGDNDTSSATVLDILFTVTATDEPLTDRLVLSNLASAGYDNSQGVRLSGSDIATVITKQPELSIEKKILSSSGGTGSTIEQTPGDAYNSLLHNGVGGEIVTYELNITNSGSNAAYEVSLEDVFTQNALPNGLSSCTTPVFTGGTGVASHRNANILTVSATSLDANSSLIVTYTCDIDANFTPGKDIINTATLKKYTNNTGGPNFVNKVIDSKTKIDLKGVISLDKDIYNTSLIETESNSSVNEGELIDFNMTLVLSPGTYKNYQFIDTKCPTLSDFSYINTVPSGSDLVVSGGDGIVSFTCKNYVARTNGTNEIIFRADNVEDIQASVSWSVVEPLVTTTKTMTPPKADAGDTIAGTFTWALGYNSDNSKHPAYNCYVEDNLSTAQDSSGKVIYDLSTFAFTATPTGYSCDFDANTGVIGCHTDNNDSVCSDATVDFSITTNPDAVVGSSYPNTIHFEGKTLPKNHYSGSASNEGNVKKEATAGFELNSPAKPIKTIIATSETATDDSNLNTKPPVAIGEVISYEIEYAFPEGITQEVQLVDQMLNEAWAQYVPNSFYIRKSSNDLNGSSSAAQLINAAAVDTNISIPDNLLVFSPNVNAPKKVIIEMGDVKNSNISTTTSTEKYIIGMQFKVKNSATNAAAQDKNNKAKINFTQGSGALKSLSSKAVAVRIVEPDIEVSKLSENGVTFEAGDSVKYKLSICNDQSLSAADATTGFDWNISDTLPSKLSGSNIAITQPSGVNVTAAFSDAQHLIGTIDRLDPGQCVIIKYDALIAADAAYGEQFSNIVTVQSTSLKGEYGDANAPITGLLDQTPGSIHGERTGEGGINYLNQESSFTVFMNQAGIEKSVLNHQNYYAVEDNATYVIIVGTPKGSVDNFKVQDQLPAGLRLVGTPVVNTSVGVPAYTFTDNNGLLTWDFGSFTTSEKVIGRIEYNVSVENILSNQDGTILQNSAKLQYDDPNTGGHIENGPVTSQKDVRVGEPNLYIVKSLHQSVSDVQAGDTISYDVLIKNNGHTEAFDVNWSDILPQSLAEITNQHLTLQGASARRHDTNAILQSSDLSTYSHDYGDGHSSNNALKLVPFNLPVGGEILVSFDAKLQSNLVIGSLLTNNTQADYKSMFDFGRDGSECGDDDNDAQLNNYCEKAKVSFTANSDVGLHKKLTYDHTDYTIGEEVSFTLRIDIPQGRLDLAYLIDKLPQGLSYVSHDITLGNGGIIYNPLASLPVTCNTADACEVRIDFGTIRNPDNGNTNDDYIDVEIIARVENILTNQNQISLINGESSDGISGSPVYFDYSRSNGITYFDADPSAPGYQGIGIKVVEPKLVIEKTVTPTPQTINDIITYHVKLYHSSESLSDAYDLNFTDLLPFGVDFIPGSEQNIKLTQNGRTLMANAPVFPRSYGPYEFSYQAKISAGVDPSKTLYNAIELTYASLPNASGAIDSGRNGSDGVVGLNNYVATARVGVMASESSNIVVSKSADRSFVTTSDGSLNYTIRVDNNGTLDVNVTSLIDDKFGDITTIAGTTCSLPQYLAVGNQYSCTFPATITGQPGDIHVNEVIATAIDRAGNVSDDSDTAKVRILDANDAAIGQRIFYDANGNGVMDRNEKGIDGVTLDLIDNASGQVVQSQITSGDGFYLFTGLSASSYDVKITDIGSRLVNHMLTTNNQPYTTTIGASTQDLNANFGYTKPIIEVRKSSNISAVTAPSGAVTYLLDITNIGGNDVTIDSITDTVFDPLAAPSTCKTGKILYRGETYTCEFTRTISGQEGESHDNTVTVAAVDKEANVATASDDHHVIFVDGVNAYAGLLVYYDSNGNGFYDAGEPGLDSVNIQLLDSDMNVIKNTVSSRFIANLGAGLYLFDGLPSGQYYIQTNGGRPTWRAVNPEGGYVLTSGENPLPFTLSAGQIYLQANFGFALSDITVAKYADKSSLAAPGGSVTYTVVVDNTGGVDVNVTALVDDKFGDLNNVGSCSLPQSLSVGGSYSCSFTKVINGNVGEVHRNTVVARAYDSDNNERTDSASRDIAFVSNGGGGGGGGGVDGNTIGDSIYWDKNNNGIFDTGDIGFDNVTVNLKDSGGNVIDTQITSNGLYFFTDLSEDTYSVEVTDTNDVLSEFSLTAGVNPHTSIVIDSNHQIYLDIDFGYRKTIQVPLFDKNSRIMLLILLLLGGVWVLYRNERTRYM